jgi:peptidoglycan-associated lipoprotein
MISKSTTPSLAAAALCAAAACATAKPAAPPQASTAAAAPAAPAPAAPAQEVATGELREALLKLQRIHFGLDSAVLLPEAQKALGDAGLILKKHEQVAIFVEGNSDERGTSEYNVALSERRARTVIDFLAKLGIPESRLTIVPKGESNPLESGASQSAFASNRRVDFRLQRGPAQIVLEAGTRYDDKGKAIANK